MDLLTGSFGDEGRLWIVRVCVSLVALLQIALVRYILRRWEALPTYSAVRILGRATCVVTYPASVILGVQLYRRAGSQDQMPDFILLLCAIQTAAIVCMVVHYGKRRNV